ncbi:hypothetical protein [Escherichia phage vB_EcoM-UFV05]|nr:hypothetical protein [Escherichia phage vB_EcoM-UFV09]UYE93150.1 hypothetical protein [Escherichia phage vB_EcoM-UFV05]UYL84043.1 hypothetical protein [Escherichia phage vB_EcoM-UFV06]UYL84329.1 hypothetical protein [Escherichia phage vB_EcoM-UFV10]UYL84615.1 hypothetical protein [Escherichia phage vB_EcoM-UFV11]
MLQQIQFQNLKLKQQKLLQLSQSKTKLRRLP